jgi:hypothetical protein
LFQTVREISLFDEYPFEHEFFIRIAQAFPFLQELTLDNKKPQKNKSNDDYQNVTIAKYPYLKYIDLILAHEDYIEQFLLNTKTYLSYRVELITNHCLIEKVTHNFRRDTTRYNCSKITYLYDDYDISSLPIHFNNYFSQTTVL